LDNAPRRPLNIICFGAHPDDCEILAGGTAVLWIRLGHRVLFVSMTRGDVGHYEVQGKELAERRKAESERAARLGGYQCRVLDHPDGELIPSLEIREEVVRLIREWKADLVLTHRPNDYHPDHRYTSQVVQDAAYMVCVPFFCPETPRLERNPVFLYLMDTFTRPVPFRVDIAVAVDEVMETKWAMLDAMDSQFYEWLPWMEGQIDAVPEDPQERLHWLKRTWEPILRQSTEMAGERLIRHYGAVKTSMIRFAEAYEICEYGHQPNSEELRALFAFIPDPS
jgi:N-acetylglucosamine malate deacetylase 1